MGPGEEHFGWADTGFTLGSTADPPKPAGLCPPGSNPGPHPVPRFILFQELAILVKTCHIHYTGCCLPVKTYLLHENIMQYATHCTLGPWPSLQSSWIERWGHWQCARFLYAKGTLLTSAGKVFSFPVSESLSVNWSSSSGIAGMLPRYLGLPKKKMKMKGSIRNWFENPQSSTNKTGCSWNRGHT